MLTDDQRSLLLDTLERANAACTYVSEQAWQAQEFGKFALQKVVYSDLRARFGLTAQMAIRAIGKVADAYKVDHKRPRTFHRRGAFPYDERILNWRQQSRTVSIWTLAGRIVVPYVTGAHHHALLAYQRGETDLIYRKGEFYLLAPCEVEEPLPSDVDELLGVDLGVTNIATDSDGTIATSDPVEQVRRRYARRRAILQRVGTRSAKRRLRKIARREANFRRNENHRISKTLVSKAQGTGRGIALEALTGIRDRVTVRRS
jgi:putative transposase